MSKFVFRTEDANRIIAWPCKITVPQSGGTVEEQEVTARFRLLSGERTAEIAKNAGAMQGDASILKECLVGFVDLKNESGQDVSDSDALGVLTKLPYAVAGLMRGYFDMLAGRLPKN